MKYAEELKKNRCILSFVNYIKNVLDMNCDSIHEPSLTILVWTIPKTADYIDDYEFSFRFVYAGLIDMGEVWTLRLQLRM
jgi:hypothetical protein